MRTPSYKARVYGQKIYLKRGKGRVGAYSEVEHMEVRSKPVPFARNTISKC